MKRTKIIAMFLLFVLAFSLLAGCGGSSNLPDLSGTYVCTGYSFDIAALTFYTDGTVDLSMDWEYTGTYKKSGDRYVFSITGGKSAVSDHLAKERDSAYRITAAPNGDNALTVYIEAKSGYTYYGNESAIFEKA